MAGVSLAMANLAPDEGLSASFNSWFTLFGQFFDHGLDLVGKGQSGTVFIPLQPDDPLYVPGSQTNFMVLTRATVDAEGNSVNITTPFVDQNQTYTSHPSHQVFLREYVMIDERPVATGNALDGPNGGLPTWGQIKEQAREMLRHRSDRLPRRQSAAARDRSLRQLHSRPRRLPAGRDVLDPDAPVAARRMTCFRHVRRTSDRSGGTNEPVGHLAVRTGHAFLDDIAHDGGARRQA